MKPIKIETDVVQPGHYRDHVLESLNKMNIGDSFLVDNRKEAQHITVIANKVGISVRTFKEGNKIRIWKHGYDPKKDQSKH